MPLSLANLKRAIVLLIGVTVLLVGAALLVLPGPGMLVIVAGLALLGTEFAWARRLLHGARSRARVIAHAARRRCTEAG